MAVGTPYDSVCSVRELEAWDGECLAEMMGRVRSSGLSLWY